MRKIYTVLILYVLGLIRLVRHDQLSKVRLSICEILFVSLKLLKHYLNLL